MKKILCFIICLSILLAGCAAQNTNETQAEATNNTENVVADNYATEPITILPQQEAMYAVSVPAVSENAYSEDGTVIFSYTRQSMMLTLPDPDVADKIIAPPIRVNRNFFIAYFLKLIMFCLFETIMLPRRSRINAMDEHNEMFLPDLNDSGANTNSTVCSPGVSSNPRRI